MTSVQCALCGDNERIVELYKKNFHTKQIKSDVFSARRTPDKIHYRIVRCLNCGLVFSNPIFATDKIFKLYGDSTFDYDVEAKFLKKTYGFYLEKLIKNKKKEKIKLLDIGCGNGFFLEEARSMGVGQVFGIEPGRKSVYQAPKELQKNIKIGFFETNSYKNESFDIVCSFHTLDHIVDPNSFLETAYSILKKGGRALLIVHDTEGLSVKLFGENSPIFDIEHIFLFNKKNLKNLFLKHNFKNIEIFDVMNRYPLYYWAKMIPMPNKIKKNLLSFLKVLKLINLSVSLSVGNIGIIVTK